MKQARKTPKSPLTPAQIRAGRAILRWSAEQLAGAAQVGVATIRRAEIAEGETSMTTANNAAVRGALEGAGLEFIDENGGGAGVRLTEPSRAKTRAATSVRTMRRGALRSRPSASRSDICRTVAKRRAQTCERRYVRGGMHVLLD